MELRDRIVKLLRERSSHQIDQSDLIEAIVGEIKMAEKKGRQSELNLLANYSDRPLFTWLTDYLNDRLTVLLKEDT